jgi:hypothetical protein
LKIAFLNPWAEVEAAENQEFSKNRIAAARLGHQLIQCTNSADVAACAPDFVLVASPTQPKLNDVPHYGIIHAPLDRYFTNRSYFHNLLSYDGYLAVADTLNKLIRDVTFGTGRSRPVGFFFNTSNRCELSPDLRDLIDRRALLITYFGTNWDNRHVFFFKKLSESEGVQLCGPAKAWAQINQRSYGGELPWDGSSVQERYAANGIGLCMLSDDHLRSDVISNRIFEVTAAGAIAFCCDTPWIRKHFGDSVYYFDQNLDSETLASAILKLRDSVYSDPEAAIRKAARARAIFEANFTSEILFGNVLRYHEELRASRSAALRTAEELYSPFISVVIRCGSRELKYVQRAVSSIARQTYGRFEVIFVRHKELDLSALTASPPPRIASFRIVDCPGGNRSASLWAGLNAASGAYFCVLDDDDWWFSDHFEKLFHPLPEEPPRKFLAYSGSVAVRPESVPITGGGRDDRELLHFGIESLESWDSAAGAFASNCFVASRDLLSPRLLTSPGMESAEDSYLILALMAQAEPRFSYAATSVFDRSLPDQSSFAKHPQRFEDELTLQLRLMGPDRPRFLPVDFWKSLSQHWERAPYVGGGQRGVGAQTLLSSWELVGSGYDLPTSQVSGDSSFSDPQAGSAAIHTAAEPWAYAAVLSLPKPSRESVDYALAVELRVREGKVGVGLLNQEENSFLYRESLRTDPEPKTILIPIRAWSDVGRLVIQNWETHGKSIADLISIRILARPQPSTK